MKLIGITGKAGSGKSTTAQLLTDVCSERFLIVQRVAFADALKQTCRDMGWNGVKDAKGRRLLQLIGTEAGRRCIGEDVWINKVVLGKADVVIIEDCRFDNEVAWVREQGGIILRTWGRQKYRWWHRAYWHASERVPKSHDYAINTSGNVPQIPEKVYEFAS